MPVNQPKDSNQRKEASSVKFFHKINVVGRMTGVAGGKGLNLCGFSFNISEFKKQDGRK